MDLVVHSGRVVTLDRSSPVAEAVAISGERIVAVGTDRDILPLADRSTRRIDLTGRLVVPGFIDSHAHLLALGEKLSGRVLDLSGTRSPEEVVAMVAARSSRQPAGTWILGRCWDNNAWPGRTLPHRALLDRATRDHRVCLTRLDCHAVWANAAALHAAGIEATSPTPEGGEIVRDPTGEPTGVLIDNAAERVTRLIPAPNARELRGDLQAAFDACSRWGITGLHDAGVSREALTLYREEAQAGELPVRLYVMIPGADRALLEEQLERGPEIDIGGKFLTVRAVKLFADGALGSRGAALMEDYADRRGHRGLETLDEETIVRIAAAARQAGLQVGCHAIGDRANRTVLDAFARVLEPSASPAAHRFRIEHAQIVHPDDFARFGRLGLIAAVQTIHCTDDMPWLVERLGEKRVAERTYAWRSLLEGGARICNGTDAPVAGLSPIAGFHAAVTRQDAAGRPDAGFHAEQRLTREEALRAATLGGAYASFREQELGALVTGKLADLVVLSRDILTVPSAEILETEVELTVCGGRVVYETG